MITNMACVDLAIKKHLEDASHIVFLVRPSDLSDTHKALAGTLPFGSTCSGVLWLTPDGKRVSVKTFDDLVPKYPTEVVLIVCGGGKLLTQEECLHVDRWLKAVNTGSVPLFDSER